MVIEIHHAAVNKAHLNKHRSPVPPVSRIARQTTTAFTRTCGVGESRVSRNANVAIRTRARKFLDDLKGTNGGGPTFHAGSVV